MYIMFDVTSSHSICLVVSPCDREYDPRVSPLSGGYCALFLPRKSLVQTTQIIYIHAPPQTPIGCLLLPPVGSLNPLLLIFLELGKL